MEKSETIETPLPEEVIHHIQSFMSGKEATRSAILSKSWYAAWLTRPTIDLDDRDFGNGWHATSSFKGFAKKKMQRYRDLSLKIESFSLYSSNSYISDRTRHNLIVSAINMGATHLRLELPHSLFVLPQEVLGSQTLVKLFLDGLKFEGSYVINCLMLKSLTLHSVKITSDDVFKDLTSRCISMEELSLSDCFGLELRRTNMYELHKLRRLFLSKVNVDNMFFTDFASRFPCLKDLSLHRVKITSDDVFKDLISRCISMEELSLSNCSGLELRGTDMYELHKLKRLFLNRVDVDDMFFTDFDSRFPCLKDLTVHYCSGCPRIHISNTSLQTISFKFKPKSPPDRVKFDVPNIRKFYYSVSGLPSHLFINGASRWEWELDLYITWYSFPKTSWLWNLKKVLNKFRLSRISLFIDVRILKSRATECEHEVDVEVVPNPLVVENLTIHAPPTFCSALLVRAFEAFRPKFVTHCDWPEYPWMLDNVKSVRKRLIQLLFVSHWQNKFGQFGMKKVNMDVYDEFDRAWRPFQLKKRVLDPKDKVRFQLIWED